MRVCRSGRRGSVGGVPRVPRAVPAGRVVPGRADGRGRARRRRPAPPGAAHGAREPGALLRLAGRLPRRLPHVAGIHSHYSITLLFYCNFVVNSYLHVV